MDELDRLYRRLVQNIRGVAPELLSRPFELSQIYQELVPYRTNRRELGFDSNEDYELALMQLLGGLRGYLTTDSELQKVMRGELSSSNPDLASFRVYATSVVSLAPEPLRTLEHEVTLRGQGSVNISTSAGTVRGSAGDAAALAARATETFDATPSVPPRAAPSAPAPSAQHLSERPEPRASQSPDADRPRDLRPTSAPPSALERMGPPPVQHAQDVATGCRYCGGVLPDGRKVTFCPHCGHDLTVQHCPACGTECEIEWKFCITCGRNTA